MEKRWTDAQVSAISANNKKILVSAAAGSGKTATLIERIICSLTNADSPMSLDRMLVVTFTKAAASELRLRILSALNAAIADDPSSKHLRRQLLLLESAQICTIDSFCLGVLKNEFQNSGNDASFRIGDSNELLFIKKKAMDEAVEQVFCELREENDEEAVLEFLSVLTGPRTDKELANKLINVREMLSNTPLGIEYIKRSASSLSEDARNGEINESAKAVILKETEYLFRHIKAILNGYKEAFSAYEGIISKYLPLLEDEVELCNKVLSGVKNSSYTEVREIIASFNFKRLPIAKTAENIPLKDAFIDDRGKYKKWVENLKNEYYLTDADDICLINEKSAVFLSVLYRVLSRADEIYAAEKRNAHVLEFEDLKAGVYKLFLDSDGKPTPLALEYSSRYDIIYIDEYQDVDPIQDAIFNALAVNSRLFMVGDIKQSIYGFRGSDPSIFGRLRSSFEDYRNGEDSLENAAIYMSNNFRCSKPIINASNYVCSHLFLESNDSSDSVGYTSNDDLVFSKITPEGVEEKPCEFCVIEPDPDIKRKSTSITAEIKYVTMRISEMMKNEKKEDGEPLSYSNFAILCSKNSQVKQVSETLKSMGYPCDDAPSDNFFSSPEILLIRSLLSAIDNPFSDLYLSSVLLSPFFGFTDDEILKIRKYSDKETLYEAMRDAKDSDRLCFDTREKCKMAEEFLCENRELAASMSISEFLPLIWNKADIGTVATFEASDNRSARMRRDNVDKLYNYALAYSSASFKTLHSFLAFLDDIIEADPKSQVFPVSGNEVTENIHVMTIHRSKGLEFPVCFLIGMGNSIGNGSNDKEVVFDPEAGLYFDPAAKEGLVKIQSPYKAAVLSRIDEKQTLEKIRLLYVAMTRARERLIITATSNKYFSKVLEKYPPAFSVYASQVNVSGVYPILSAQSYGEWILHSDPFKNADSSMVFVECKEKDIDVDSLIISEKEADVSGEFAERLTDEQRAEMITRFESSYFSVSSLIPAKVSVSELSPTALDDTEYLIGDDNGSISFDDRPWFMLGDKNIKASDRGTATHLFLQFSDFERWKDGTTEDEISRLVSLGFILSEHAELIDRKMLESFKESRFFDKIMNAKTLYREQRFNIPFPARIFTEDSEKKELFTDEYVLVQGVIDLIIIDECVKITLADYKTDYVSKEVAGDESRLISMFSERYSHQLSYYALAVEKLFGKKPDEVLIYSLSARKEVNIILDPAV